jgi:rod shape determining protein RodA
VIIFYLGSLALILVSLASSPIRNIHAWITIGGFTFEPSELMKLALIILLAKYFSQRHIHINQFRHIIVSGIYCAIPTLLILSQPDLGSAVIVVLIWFGILMSAGINKKHFFLLASIGILAAYLSWIFVLKPYQKERIISFINPYKDPTGIGYNIIQSKIAIGSGYFLGSGLGKGSQASLGFLPEPYNDFVFAALSEQFGFIGVVGVFAVLITILYRSVVIGQRTENNFGRLFSLGMVIFLLSHIWISSAVNLGLMPITGIPFSFLSYGGSHLMSLMIGLGILQSIKRYG